MHLIGQRAEDPLHGMWLSLTMNICDTFEGPQIMAHRKRLRGGVACTFEACCLRGLRVPGIHGVGMGSSLLSGRAMMEMLWHQPKSSSDN